MRSWAHGAILGAAVCVGCSDPQLTLQERVVSADLSSALERQEMVRAVIAFAPPPSRDVARLRQRTAEATRAVLAAVDPQDLAVTRTFETVPAMAGWLTRRGAERLAQHPDVIAVSLDPASTIALAESVPLIGADQVQLAGIDGEGITVAVLDTGVDRTHPDLVSVPIVAEHCVCEDGLGGGCCPDSSVEQDGLGSAADDHGHGTGVTSVIASQGVEASMGVAPAVSVVAVKVLDAYGLAYSASQIVGALDWIIATQPSVQVINMSLGSFETFASACDSADAWTIAYTQAIDTLTSNGVLVFASSGNDAMPAAISAPACIEATIAVGAVYDDDIGPMSFGACDEPVGTADTVACFSNASSLIDLLGPGAMVTTSTLGGGADPLVGTSFASPAAAGAAALLLQIDGSLAPAAIESLLETTGVSVTDTRNNLVFPRVDVHAAALSLGIPQCGDGVIHATEECDDGNDAAGDGCSGSCVEEYGFDCRGEPSMCASECGDGVLASDEGCDDGNDEAGDGCSPACTREPTSEGGSGGEGGQEGGGAPAFLNAGIDSCRDNCCCETVGGTPPDSRMWLVLVALGAFALRRKE